MKIQTKDIVLDTQPLIRQHSEKVALPISDEDHQLALDLLEHVIRSQDDEIAEKEGIRPAVGIAAVQVGILKQILAIYVEMPEGEEDIKLALANPHIVSHSVQQTYLGMGEGCLSVADDHPGYVPRYARIKVKAYDCLTNQEITFRAEGYLAIVLQHEMDHFKGVLFYDHINTKNPWEPIKDAIVIE